MIQGRKYYNIQAKSEIYINPFKQKIKNKMIYDYNNIDSPKKETRNKLKYKYPSLEKHQYRIPMNFSVDLNAPIFENSNFYKKKNLNLSVSMKNIEIDKENDNKKYKRILPTFTIPNRDPLLDKIKIQEEKEVKKFVAFEGEGFLIDNVNVEGLHVNKDIKNSINKSLPICNFNIRLFNGEIIKCEFNYNKTLRDVYTYVKKLSGSNNFILLEGFPPRPLNQLNKSLKELNLENTTLTQKIN